MKRLELNDTVNSVKTASNWKTTYIAGSAAALLGILLTLLDIGFSFTLPKGETAPGTLNAADWFKLFQNNWFHGLRDLGILNVIHMVLGVPLFLALYAAHREFNKAFAAAVLILFFMGGAVYISNNAAVPMFVLSGKHAAAATDSQRMVLAAAGEAILARGADFTPGSFAGFLLPSLAQIGMSFVMLQGRVFSRAAAFTGILGFGSLLVFTVWVTFAPALFELAMILAMVGGLSALAWNIMVSLKLFQLGRLEK